MHPVHEGMVPGANRARVAKIDLQLIVQDFLNRHSKAEKCYELPDTDAVLRQDDLPEDARVLWAQLDQDDSVRENALRAARGQLAFLDAGGEHADLIAQLDAALSAPPARNLLVGIASETFDMAARGAEPEHAFDHLAFFPKPEPTPEP